jgi:hypothetical protein
VIFYVPMRAGIYWSRRRGLWQKGLTSGAGQDLLKVELDCDADCARFVVHQHGDGFCHLQRRTCWPAFGDVGGIPALLYAATCLTSSYQNLHITLLLAFIGLN